MSKISIAGASTGTATFTIESPATSTNRTITIPDATTTLVGTDATQTLTNKSIVATQLTGTIAAARLPAGSVLQVVQATKTDIWSSNSLGAQWNDIPGQGNSGTFEVKITPSSASNKILIMSHLPMSSTASQVGRSQLRRNGTAIFTGDSAGSRPLGVGQTYFGDVAFGNQSSVNMQNLGCVYLDSPNTTSEVTYKMVVGADNTGGSGTVRLNLTNRDSNGAGADTRAASSIIVMEIKG
jgi:hypothetical protein